MDIRIDENYRITSDPRNVILVEEKIVQDGENKGQKYDNQISFHSSLELALKDYKRVKVNSSQATTINKLLEEVREINTTIEKMCGGLE